MGSAAPAIAELPASEALPVARRETAVETRAEVNAESLRDAVLNALGNQQMLVSLLENAEWRLEGNALTARVAASSTMIEMSFTSDARRVASAAASGRAGRPIKMLVEPGGTAQTVAAARKSSSSSSSVPNGSARSRAEQDPIVQRMKERFGAEIRTVIDYREKG
jgi:DNA polymerase-3 subunit gamma/tau